MMLVASWFDMAADRRCAWPRRPFGGPVAGIGRGKALLLVGLELMAPPTPKRESPPTNSLPPRRCPRLDGVIATSSEGVNGGVVASLRPEASLALKLKLGNVDTARRWVKDELCEGPDCACIDNGRRGEGFGRACASFGRGRAGKEKSGLEIISILGAPCKGGACTKSKVLDCLP